jgi:hypothetical protein
MSEESAYQRQFCDETAVGEELSAREEDCTDRIEDLKERRRGINKARQEIETTDPGGSDGGEVVTMRYRREFANAVTPLAGSSYDKPVEKREFLAELMTVCGLSLPEARGVLQAALARGFWVEYSGGSLHENSNVNPARPEPPELAIDGEDYGFRGDFFDHLKAEYPRREEVDQ